MNQLFDGMFDLIDATGTGRKSDPRMRNVEAEMIRSHELCLKISSKKQCGGGRYTCPNHQADCSAKMR